MILVIAVIFVILAIIGLVKFFQSKPSGDVAVKPPKSEKQIVVDPIILPEQDLVMEPEEELIIKPTPEPSPPVTIDLEILPPEPVPGEFPDLIPPVINRKSSNKNDSFSLPQDDSRKSLDEL